MLFFHRLSTMRPERSGGVWHWFDICTLTALPIRTNRRGCARCATLNLPNLPRLKMVAGEVGQKCFLLKNAECSRSNSNTSKFLAPVRNVGSTLYVFMYRLFLSMSRPQRTIPLTTMIIMVQPWQSCIRARLWRNLYWVKGKTIVLIWSDDCGLITVTFTLRGLRVVWKNVWKRLTRLKAWLPILHRWSKIAFPSSHAIGETQSPDLLWFWIELCLLRVVSQFLRNTFFSFVNLEMDPTPPCWLICLVPEQWTEAVILYTPSCCVWLKLPQPTHPYPHPHTGGGVGMGDA